MKLLLCGDQSTLIDCATATEARYWAAHLTDRWPVTLGASTVLVPAPVAQVREALVGLGPPNESDITTGTFHRILVHYDGPDLDLVASHSGLSVSEVIALHTRQPWLVGFCGFAPGFAYLVGGDPRLAAPRLDVPRPRIEAGSVGIAGPYSGIYPRESAGGWLIIGHTAAALWDLERTPPALFQPGDAVQFEAE